jgi:hypothetical protein
VVRRERQAVYTRGRDDEPVARVPVERHREVGERDHHFDVERKNLDDADRRGVPYADVEASIERQPAIGKQHLCFPEADRRQAYFAARRQAVECPAFLRGEPR